MSKRSSEFMRFDARFFGGAYYYARFYGMTNTYGGA